MYYKHILTGFASIIRDEGVLGLYKGLLPCLASIMPYMGSCFYIVEFLRSQCFISIVCFILRRWRHARCKLRVWDHFRSHEQVARLSAGYRQEASAGVSAKSRQVREGVSTRPLSFDGCSRSVCGSHGGDAQEWIEFGPAVRLLHSRQDVFELSCL